MALVLLCKVAFSFWSLVLFMLYLQYLSNSCLKSSPVGSFEAFGAVGKLGSQIAIDIEYFQLVSQSHSRQKRIASRSSPADGIWS